MAALKLDTETIVKKLNDIPSLPSVVYELSRVINDPMSSTKDVEAIMAQDLGMTTKVLKLANSAYYAIPGGVTSLSRAIGFIGFDTVHQLVLSASIIQALEIKGPSIFDVNEFWKHSIVVAIASEVIAKYVKHPTPADLFTVGLVHDMGKVALFLAAPEVLVEITARADKNKLSFLEIEEENKITPHTELGKLLAEKWKLPRNILVAAKYHHENDMQKRQNISSDLNQIIDIVMLANLLTHALRLGNSGHHKVIGAPTELLTRLEIHPQNDMPTLLKQLKAQIEQASEFIRMIGSK